MSRNVLDASRIHPAVRGAISAYGADVIREVQDAVAAHAVVIVGMAQNPFPRKARRLLDARGIRYAYLEYGSYFGQYRRRLPLKLWTGWPTFPMIFVNGTFIGGASDLEALLASGEFDTLLASR